jgi:hypothetical protein
MAAELPAGAITMRISTVARDFGLSALRADFTKGFVDQLL